MAKLDGARRSATVLWLTILPIFTASAEDAAKPVFHEVGKVSGIDFVHRMGSREKDWIVEVNGSGVALFDYDGDGDLDIYFVNGSEWETSKSSPRNRLYRNDGAWRFVDVTDASGLGDTGWGSGVACADVDNDGDLDVYVANQGVNRLFLNRGGGRFEGAKSFGAEDPRWSAAASFADFDRDGLVDLFVANYVEFDRGKTKKRGDVSCSYKGQRIFCGPGGLVPARDGVYRNLGGGKFRDVSAAWGISKVPASFGLGTLVCDVDRDGFPDVLVANDTRANHLFLNRKGRGFDEAGVFLGLAYNDYGVAQAGMGIAAGDTRGTGMEDLFLTHFEDDSNTLYHATEDGIFAEATFPSGLGAASYRFLGWGTFFFDADGDRDLDLFVANGHVAPQVDRVRGSFGYAQRNQLFLNDGRGRFTESRTALAESERTPKSSRGAACGDLDGDGDLDVVVNNIDAAPSVLRNDCSGRWLRVRLRGTRSNRAAIGARVVLHDGGKSQVRVLRSGSSWASQGTLTAHFALSIEDRASRLLDVDWPSGLRERFTIRESSEVLLIEGSGEPISIADE